jgi:hypothetical protein
MRPRGHDGLTIGVAAGGVLCLLVGVFSLGYAKSGGGAWPLLVGGILLVVAAGAIVFILRQSSFFNG